MRKIKYNKRALRYSEGSEAGHWYIPTIPALVTEVRARSGKWRPPTLREARELDLFPGVTGVIGIEHSYVLTEWQKKMVALAAATTPHMAKWMSECDEKQLLANIIREADSIAAKAAAAGRAIHAHIERYLPDLNSPEKHPLHPFYEATISALQDKGLPTVGWRFEHTAVHSLGFGCRIDMLHPNANLLCDLKTKEFWGDEHIKPYDHHREQLWAQAQAAGRPNARKFNLFLSRNHPGKAKLCEIIGSAEPWEVFLAKLDFFQRRKRLRRRVAECGA